MNEETFCTVCPRAGCAAVVWAFSEELNLSLSVEDVQLELTANYTTVNALKGASINTIIIITATKGANLTWSVTPALISGLSYRISGDRFVIYGAPANGTQGTHAYTITTKNSKGSQRTHWAGA